MTKHPLPFNELLKQVSRSFYLTMRVLPGGVREQIGLAYLLARATDTIADTELVPAVRRLAALRALRERVLGLHLQRLDFGDIVQQPGAAPNGERSESSQSAPRDIEHDKLTHPQSIRPQGSRAERVVLERIEEILGVLECCSPSDRKLIGEVLATITSGQELDLERFADATMDRIVALPGEADLSDYTYRVAGCVGEFWTKICRAHLFPRASLDETALVANGTRFGQGLQLVNILRDLPSDLRAGRCYIPAASLRGHGLRPEDLLRPANEPRFRPLYHDLLAQADAHLAAGWVYTNSLPPGCLRVRLACAWPILIGVKTLARLRAENVLDATRRVKISRAEVRNLMVKSVLASPWRGAWQRLFEKERGAS